MKKTIVFGLAIAMLLAALVGCGAKETAAESAAETAAEPVSYVLTEVYENLLAMQPADKTPVMFDSSNDHALDSAYPELKNIETAQMVFYAAPIFGYATEVMLVECKNESDVPTVQKIFQSRIDAAVKDGGCDPGIGEIWQKNARVQTSGNYVAMIVLPDGCVIPENVFLGK